MSEDQKRTARTLRAAIIFGIVAATLALWALTSSEVAEKPRMRSNRAVFA